MADEKLKDSAVIFTELDDGKIETGTPKQTPIFDGKNPWVSGEDVPLKPIHCLLFNGAVIVFHV
jgi:hypothetical protein